MADDKVSGKVGLNTDDFKTGIAAMNRELRVLESGFRASAASLGDWTDDATGLELRVKSLNSQMDVQTRKVAAVRAEYERVKAETGENSRAAQDLEIKLNKETETLGKMESELRDTEGSLQEMKQGEDAAGQGAQDMTGDVEGATEAVDGFQTILGVVSGIAAGVVTVIAAIGAAAIAAGAGLAKLVFDAAEAGSQLQDLSDKTGISTTRLQELQFVGDQVGTSLDTITGAQAKLIRSMNTASSAVDDYNQKLIDAHKAGKKMEQVQADLDKNLNPVLEAFNELGVSVRDSNGELRNQDQVFSEVIDALGKVKNPVEADALAMQIFGKSAQELNPLVKLGAAGMADLTKQAHDLGAVMSEEDVAALDNFDDTMSGLQDTVKGVVGSFASQFLPIAQLVADNVKELFSSEAFKRGVAQFNQLLQGVIKVTVDILKDLFSGNIQGGLAKIFGADNASALIKLFKEVQDFLQGVLIPFFQTHAGEIREAVTQIITVLIGIIGIVTRLSIAWVETWLRIHDIIDAVWNGFLAPIFNILFAWLSKTLPVALRSLSNYWTTVLLPAIRQVWTFLNISVFPLFRAIENFISAVFNLALRALAGLWQNVLLSALQDVWSFLQNNILPVFNAVVDFVSSTFQPVFEGLANFFNTILVPAFQAIGNAISIVIDWLNSMANVLNNIQLPDFLTPGSPTPFENGLVGINRALRELNQQLPVLSNGLQFATNGLPIGGANVDNSTSSRVNVIGNVIVQGNTTPDSLASALVNKGRRY